MKKKLNTIEDYLYLWGLILGVVFLCGTLYVSFFGLPKVNIPFSQCMFLRITGLYCPGCGGTRAVISLLSGKVLLSLWYHPLVLYTAILYIAFMGTQTLERLHVKKVKGILFHNWFLYVALGIVVVNFISKNVLLIFFHIGI